MAPTAGARWIDVLRTIRSELPGEWSLRGRGLKAKLLREPGGWAIGWIGGSKASSMRMHAGVMPAVTHHLVFAMGIYGLDMADIPRGPRRIDLGADGDLAVAKTFAQQALARIEELSQEYLALRAETALSTWDGGQKMPPFLLTAPGWRLVRGEGDPVEAARRCIDAAMTSSVLESEAKRDAAAFFETMIGLYESEGREAALTWLGELRDRNLAELGYGEDAIIKD